MRNRAITVILIVVTILAVGSAQAKTTGYLPEQSELFLRALSQVGLTPEEVRINSADLGLWGGDRYKLKLLSMFCDNPWKISPYTRSLSSGLLANAGNLGTLMTSAHSRLDAGVRLGLVGDPLADTRKRVDELQGECLATALSELAGLPVDSVIGGAAGRKAYDQVPLQVRQAAALFLFTVPKALRYREAGLVKPMLHLGLDPQTVYRAILDYSVSTFAEEDGLTGNEVADDLDQVLLIESLLDNVDWNLLNAGATLTAIAAQEAQKLMPAEAPGIASKHFLFSAQTPWGAVVLRGAGPDRELPEDTLLVIDTGGRDRYACCAGTRDFVHPVSVCIDLAGDDVYENKRDDVPSFGAGIFGYGVLIDCAGDDTYSTTYAGEGAGIFGTGVLYDMGGNDHYSSYGNSQASGSFGAGLLVDMAGDDRYDTYKYGQGYGFTKGCGMLIDCGGDDHYYANLVDHFNGGLYGANHHVHFVQGSAYGRRGDFTEGHSWAGGFGMLCDGGGNDRYEADCYGQGNAYWYSIGMLVDKGGDDVYRAGQYSLASAPHFACGILQDEAGNDRYTVGIRQSLGHGRDWSLAWLEDAAGDDCYQGARTTLGVSHVNAISVFWDRGGNDVYIAKGPSFGESETETSNSARDWLLTLGLFIDGGGQDRYLLLPGEESYEASNTFAGDITDLDALTPLDFAGDGLTWVRSAGTPEAPGFLGVGLDSE